MKCFCLLNIFHFQNITFTGFYKNKYLHFGKNRENSQMQKGKTTFICLLFSEILVWWWVGYTILSHESKSESSATRSRSGTGRMFWCFADVCRVSGLRRIGLSVFDMFDIPSGLICFTYCDRFTSACTHTAWLYLPWFLFPCLPEDSQMSHWLVVSRGEFVFTSSSSASSGAEQNSGQLAAHQWEAVWLTREGPWPISGWWSMVPETLTRRVFM